MENKDIISRIKTLTAEDFTKRFLQRFLDLAILVDKNYEHIEQLETLKTIFEGGLSDYYKEYHAEKHELCIIIGQVCRNTFYNHYKKEADKLFPSIYDVQMEIFGKENSIISYKELSYAKN